MNKISTLTDQSIEVASYIYKVLPDFPAEEEWNTVSKLRNAANDLMFYCAEAEGQLDKHSAKYEWGSACKSASGLSALCRFTIKQKFIDFDLDIMVAIENLISATKANYQIALQLDDEKEEKQMDNWLKRYKIWKETEI